MPVHEGFWGGPRAAPSPRARESTGRPRKCARLDALGSDLPPRAAPGLLSALSCTSRATHGAGESWPGQEPRQARRQQPVTVSGTVVTNRNIIYPGFRFSLEWLKLESEGGHSVWQQG